MLILNMVYLIMALADINIYPDLKLLNMALRESFSNIDFSFANLNKQDVYLLHRMQSNNLQSIDAYENDISFQIFHFIQ